MSWAQLKQEPIVEGFAELADAKKRFAKAMLYNPDDTYKAALVVFGFDTNRALRASNEWPYDPEVAAERERLLAEYGSLHFLPDKSEVARKIINIAEESKTTQEKLLAYRLYADLMSMIEKPGTNVNNNNVILGHNKVMIVKAANSDAEWAARAASQQAMLVQQAAEDIGADDDVEVE